MSSNKITFQKRTFLLLADESQHSDELKRILASPLYQVERLVARLMENDFASLKDNLDSIKGFAGGITRAEKFSSKYAIARYHTLMFPFQQQFHSSYRANQGKVLEGLIKFLLREQTSSSVPESVKKEMRPHLGAAFGVKAEKIPGNDIDVMGISPETGKIIIIQLRSRDDTGGTTAKSSLVELLRGLLRLKLTPKVEILYLVGIWESHEAQQRQSTINKFYQALRDHTRLSESDFAQIGEGIEVSRNLTLKMAYGLDEILNSIFLWAGKSSRAGKSFFEQTINQVSEWDDLWVAYALSTLELEAFTLHGISNVKLLGTRMQELGLELDMSTYKTIQQSVEDATPKLVAHWTETSLPVDSPADQMLYLRDLLFLKAIYQRAQEKKRPALRKQPVALREASLPYQPRLFTNAPNFKPSGSFEPELVSFRELVPDIADTTYLTHPLYYYPAKFIPQVVRFCLKEYSPENGWVIDPFAGSATVGLEAMLCRRNAILLDLNLMLNHIVSLKMTVRQTDLNKVALGKLLEAMRRSSESYRPDWSNLDYWYAPEVLVVLSRYWGWQRQMESDPYAWIIEAALLKASRQFSYTEHRAPKLFKSKSKLEDMDALLKTNWKGQLDELIYETAFDILKRVQQLAPFLAENDNQVVVFSGVDSAKYQLDAEYRPDCLISSPPYLQAQEYIRTSKLELYWLGHSEDEVKRLSKLEIPYSRKADALIETETLNSMRERLDRIDLIALVDSYFCYTLQAFENATRNLCPNGKVCIFVGNPKVDGIEVETWRIITEYFRDRGFRFEHVFEDRIKNRQLFGRRKNKNPEGMKSEFLLVLSKNP